jgi:hypothetical protein
MALTSFFFTYFKVFLNALPGILVVPTPRLMERLRGWQAFFLIFFEVFLSGRNRKFTSIDTDFLPANHANWRESLSKSVSTI